MDTKPVLSEPEPEQHVCLYSLQRDAGRECSRTGEEGLATPATSNSAMDDIPRPFVASRMEVKRSRSRVKDLQGLFSRAGAC